MDKITKYILTSSLVLATLFMYTGGDFSFNIFRILGSDSPLACSPIYQSVFAGETIRVHATGGTGDYRWAADGATPKVATGSIFTTRYNASAENGGQFRNSILLTSGDDAVLCQVFTTQRNYPADAVPRPLVCSPLYQTIYSGGTAFLNAFGGNGSYTWSAPGSTNSAGSGESFSTRYSFVPQRDSEFRQIITLQSAGQSVDCGIGIIAREGLAISVTPRVTPGNTPVATPTNNPSASVTLSSSTSSTTSNAMVSVSWSRTSGASSNADWIALVPEGKSWSATAGDQRTWSWWDGRGTGGAPSSSAPNNGTVTLTVPAGLAGKRAQFVYYLNSVNAQGEYIELGRSSVVTVTALPSPATIANSLPPPNHGMYYGYYMVDTKYGDYRSEVNCYTNSYYSWPKDAADSGENWQSAFQQDIQNAANEGRHIILEFTDLSDSEINQTLTIAKPFWSKVKMLEIDHESTLSRQQIETKITAFRAKLQAQDLGPRPIGMSHTIPLPDSIHANGLDWIGIEAYVDAPGSVVSQENIDRMTNAVNQAKAQVPSGKNIMIIGQSYARNGAWTNIQTLKDLQVPTYLLAYNDPRVLALTMFSYGRPSGAREHRELIVAHKQIAEKVLNTTVPASCGL